MTDIDKETLELKADIERVFADVTYPGDDRLVKIVRPEDSDVLERFRGVKWQDWKDNPSGFLSPKLNGDLFLLTEWAFRYYLPLYMIQALVDYAGSDLLPGEIISSFALTDKPNINEYISRRVAVFSPEQLRVVLSYLEFFRRKHEGDFSTWPFDGAISNIRKAIDNL